MANNKIFQLPNGDVAFAVVQIDPLTGLPLPNANIATFIKILGKCSALNNALREVWDGPTDRYVTPAAPMQMQIVSTSASDAAAGTGARTIRLYYLDTNFTAREEILTLNGVTPVLTVATNILRVNKMHAVSVGSNGLAAGTVSLTSVGGGITYSLITVLLPKDEQGSQNGGLAVNYEFVIEDFPPRTDIRVLAISDAVNANAIALTALFGRLYPSA